MRASWEGSFSSGTQAGEFPAFVYLPKMLARCFQEGRLNAISIQTND